jgi:hypothetical protein
MSVATACFLRLAHLPFTDACHHHGHRPRGPHRLHGRRRACHHRHGSSVSALRPPQRPADASAVPAVSPRDRHPAGLPAGRRLAAALHPAASPAGPPVSHPAALPDDAPVPHPAAIPDDSPARHPVAPRGDSPARHPVAPQGDAPDLQAKRPAGCRDRAGRCLDAGPFRRPRERPAPVPVEARPAWSAARPAHRGGSCRLRGGNPDCSGARPRCWDRARDDWR